MPRDNSTVVVVLFPGKHPDCRQYIDIPDFGPFPLDTGVVDDQGKCPGNSSVVESYRGFDYLGQALAAEGYIALSIDPLMLNNAQAVADDPNLNRARARLLLRTLEKLELWNTNPVESPRALGRDISGSIDTTAIGLMGHSRGGAAARIAANLLMTPERLAFRDCNDWSSRLKSRIAAVWEVAPFVSPEGGKDVAVVGSAWGLLAAGCEDDEVDFAPNYYITAYGAGHNFFNSEWSTTFDLCLGSQSVTYDPSTPTFPYSLGNGQSVDVPLVEQSSFQQGVLKWALTAFIKAHVGSKANPQLAAELVSTTRSSPHDVITKVEIGRANPNLASSKVLQYFERTEGIVVTPSSNRYVRTFAEHAERQFPSFKADVEKFGLPRNLLFTPVQGPLRLVADAKYDKGVVIGLPAANATSIFVPYH
ncbi:uncharacterized protein ALTATR162_LOCUS5005 [Alternaria atra]|uniref:Uncharacterized protein n=1 Tax=Alternaria atra TaxID=119953 RepID=A0A8J2I1K3_9PLEO|nr:uncharacterized protein ALTATR162_LOCUS5005 [Alternaria atra]CAG5158144.1 unnamed protein product [Alternaria atra]